MYCFDTDILAAALLREPPMQLVRRLARTPGDQQCTTAVAVAEIVYAATRNGDQELTTRIRELIAAATTVLPFDHEAAEAYGALRAQLEGVGVRLDEPSLRIAAIALSHDLTLVTASARLYDRVPGLRIENWQSLHRRGLSVRLRRAQSVLEKDKPTQREALAHQTILESPTRASLLFGQLARTKS